MTMDFYHGCWDTVKNDIMALFHSFHKGMLEVQRLNYGIITFLPKVIGADRIQHFRMICLLRCPYNLITKVLDCRVEKYADKLISPTQTAFVKKIEASWMVFYMHGLLNYTHVKKRVGIVLKLDFKKAYDKVNWDFMLECHVLRGFCDKQVLHNGTISIKLINNCTRPYFQSSKGVRQGDPVSPFLFNLAAECLTKMIKKCSI